MNLLPWPEDFLAAAGWPAVARLLERCAAAHLRGLLPQTLMLVGDPGLGREALAVELATTLICRDGGGPNCRCHACERVRRGVHPDLALLDVEPGRTEIRIKQVQELVEGLGQVPFEGARRVVIVSSCHTPPLNWEAASALLKALEEPPPHLTFLLVASNPRRVISTIVSRAVQLRLPGPPTPAATEMLARLHGLSPGDEERLLGDLGGDVGLAVSAGGDDLAEAVRLGVEIAPGALAGDGLALVRLGQLAAGGPGRLGVVTALLLRTVGSDPADAERALEAAAGLLRAEYRGAVLHVGAESLVASTLAGVRTTSTVD